MARRQRTFEDANNSESESEIPIRIKPRQRTAHAQNTPELPVQKICKSWEGSRGSRRSSLLMWNAPEILVGAERKANGGSSAGGRIIKSHASNHMRDLPLSDLNSWVWKDREDAKLAVVIGDTNGWPADKSQIEELVSEYIGIPDKETDLQRRRPKERLWLDRVEIPLPASKKTTVNFPGPLKQISVDEYFIQRPKMVKGKGNSASVVKPTGRNKASRDENGSSADFSTPSADHSLRELGSPSIPLIMVTDYSISSGESGQDSSDLSPTPPTSASSSPAPASKGHGQSRPSRAAKKKAEEALAVHASSGAELDSSSDPNFYLKSMLNDSESDSDYPSSGESDDEDDCSGVTSPAEKLSPELPVPKRNFRPSRLRSVVNVDDFIAEESEPSPKAKKAKKKTVEDSSPTSRDEIDNVVAEVSGPVIKAKKAKKKTAEDFTYNDNFTFRVGIDENLKPISDIQEIFIDLTEKAIDLDFGTVLKHLNGRPLKLATMCSGTESPLLALLLISNALQKQNYNLKIDHVFSAEIVPFKQAYIERNFNPPIIFRDIKELSIPGATHATTAYGALAPIPDGVDILVAGFSCVDFSALNNKKKSINEGGESGDTFGAIMAYANKYRPKIIVLENVYHAPWVAIRDTAVGKIGYSAEFLRVDTKDYYIPHTRDRGYMICVDARSYSDPNGNNHILKNEKKVASILSRWVATLKALQRPASCSVEAFLLPDDDPRLALSRDELAKSSRRETARREVDWSRCHGRHQDYRVGLLLGQKRPITKWEDGGSCAAPDYFWRDWILSQVERVWDTIDISYLRNLSRGFDQEFKFRFLELSQNVDRVKDTSKSGIAGCLTPTGIPFSTMRGGPLIGLEALALQGLPIDKLQLTREKQSQLQDLAGNAMSSTVVGASILAALIAAHEFLDPGTDQMEIDEHPSMSTYCGESYLVPFDLNLAAYEPITVANALDAAIKSFRLCHCEGRNMITTTALQQCNLCKHTTCVECGGNQMHEFARLKREIVSQRILPSEFESLIKKAIPMVYAFSTVSKEILKNVQGIYKNNTNANSWDAAVDAVCKAFDSVLHFQCAKRSEIWTVHYNSEHASMELVFSTDMIEWRLYAKPSPNEPVNSNIRRLLSRPIARMQPTGDDIVKGTWQLGLPHVFKFQAMIQGGGTLTRSFENNLGIGKFAETEVWGEYNILVGSEVVQRLDIDISGTYKLLQKCGTASGSLHVQTKTAESPTPLFLFLDPDRLHNPADDSFVFSHDKRRLGYGEKRKIIARIDSCWRPQKLDKVEDYSIDGVAQYRIDGSTELVKLSEAQLPISVDTYVDGQWINLPHVTFEPLGGQSVTFHRAPPNMDIYAGVNSCQLANVVLSCAGFMPESELTAWKTNNWVEISPVDHKAFFTAFAWLMEKASVLPGLDEWKESSDVPSVPCQTCAPSAPLIKWRLKPSRRANQPRKLTAFEDPAQAAWFENRLKTRPSPLVTQVTIDDTGYARLRLSSNPETLMHRAAAKLLSVYDSVQISMSWRLCTNEQYSSKISLPPFKLRNNNEDESACKPPGFLCDLRPEQSRSLTWMIRQENAASPFVEEEVEEAVIAQIGWRAEGRATKPVLVRGGVLADQVGFGKTATTLALIDTQRDRDRENAKITLQGRIVLKATLILVPTQLPDQWHSEIKKFLNVNRGYDVIVIKQASSLAKMTIARLQSADIIICSWKVCEQPQYLFNVAQFAGMVELPTKSTKRAAEVWYNHALEEISLHVDVLQDADQNLQEFISQKLAASKEKAASEETFVPSKRLRGQAYQNAKETSSGSKRSHTTAFADKEAYALDKLSPRRDVFGLGEIAAGEKDWAEMTYPIFEMFEFSRIVVDEYTYLTGKKESLAISRLKAKNRWILSATPPMQDFADIKSIAKFMGLHLGIDDVTLGVISAANIKALESERTDYELFQSFKLSHSNPWHENRHSVAQRFLDHFVRQNIADIEEIKGSSHMIPITLPAAERALYLELNQLLASSDMKLKKGKVNVDNDRSRRIREVLGTSSNAGEALMKCASNFTLDDLNTRFENAPQACDVIVDTRESQYQSLRVDFQKKLKLAEWLAQACSSRIKQYSHWKGHVGSNQFGDGHCMEDIKGMIRDAEIGYDKNDWTEFYVTPEQKAEIENAMSANKKKSINSEEDSIMDEDSESDVVQDVDCGDAEYIVQPDDRRIKPEGFDENKRMECAAVALRDVTNDLRKLSAELVSRKRCLRFFRCVRDIQKTSSVLRSRESHFNGCSCSTCGKNNLEPKEIFVLSQCGHTMCNTCLNTHANRQDECVFSGCNAVNKTYQVIEAPELGVEDDRTRVGRHYGKKLEDIIRLIKNIPDNDQVLLFVQFLDLAKKIAGSFLDNGITYLALGESGDPAKKLVAFQKDTNSTTKKKVLILNIGDASAAGSNLTNANHVIFVSPFLTETQQVYDQAMTQAMGRARRYGQTKPVHIYNFLSLKTIDIDTIQRRSGKILEDKKVATTPEFIPYESFVPCSFVLSKIEHGQKGEYGSGETSKFIMESDME